MEVRAWVSGAKGLVGRKCGLSCLSPPEMPSFPKALLPSQSWKASKVPILCDSGHVHVGFALMWLECVLCLRLCGVPCHPA